MKIAITGGSGRVGRETVAHALDQGHEVVSIDRDPPPQGAEHPSARFVQADLGDYEVFERAIAGCDALIHLAAIPHPLNHPDHVVHHNNVVSSYNALLAAATLGIKRVCQASSINAIGAAYSRWPRYDYFPLDELHPTYNEDPYSLSKWICEAQADSITRRHEQMAVASLRFHWVVPDRATVAASYREANFQPRKHMFAYTRRDAAARACLRGVTADFVGHEVFFITATDTATDTPSLEIAREHFPEVEVRGDLSGNRSFYDCAKAERILGWRHDE
jgi:nucleoside-diphosphate-sugar epimerase